MTAIMAALYFHALGPNDRVAVKPHAGPVLHAIHYLLGIQTLRAAREFPRLRRHAKLSQPDQGPDPGRFLHRLGRPRRGDHRLRQPGPGLSHRPRLDGRGGSRPVRRADRRCRARRGQYLRGADRGATSTTSAICWWIVDYNRQSLDATSAPTGCSSASTRFSRACGWRVVELRYGKRLERRAGQASRARATGSTASPMPTQSALHYQGGAAWRARIEADLGKTGAAFLKGLDDDALARAVQRPRRPLHGNAGRGVRRRARTMCRPCSSPGRSRATACRSPATRTITRA